MKLLLDTNILLWAIKWPELLPKKARLVISDLDNEVYFSPVNLWETTIKRGLGNPDFDVDARLLRREAMDNNYRELPITGIHTIAVGDLSSIHKDPFDRLLIAQAREEGLTLLTADETVSKYPTSILYIPKRQRP